MIGLQPGLELGRAGEEDDRQVSGHRLILAAPARSSASSPPSIRTRLTRAFSPRTIVTREGATPARLAISLQQRLVGAALERRRLDPGLQDAVLEAEQLVGAGAGPQPHLDLEHRRDPCGPAAAPPV